MSSSADPATISVVIPVADGAYLREAIESVVSQDRGTFALELVVIDSSQAGMDHTLEPFGDLVRYEWQAPAGIAAARNRGIELANGELLTFLDSDDLFEPGRLRAQTEALGRDPSLDAVFGLVTEFVQTGLTEDARAALRPAREAFPSHLVWTMLIRRSAFDRIGPFDTSYVVAETVDWYARALSLGLRSAMLDRVVSRRRLHDRNTGVTKWDARDDFVRVAREVLQRRRARP